MALRFTHELPESTSDSDLDVDRPEFTTDERPARRGPQAEPFEANAEATLGRLKATLRRAAVYSAFIRQRVAEAVKLDDPSEGPASPTASSPAPSPTPAPGSVINPSMRLMPHQKLGSEWLLSLYENGLSGILADEMGLGKTIQVLAFIGKLLDLKVLGPHLVVCPLSTLANWQREAATWLPSCPVVVLHGTPAVRTKAKRAIELMARRPTDAALEKLPTAKLLKHAGGIVLTTYEVATKEAEFLAKANLGAMVVDEAHRLKNFNCQLIRALETIPADGRYVLTGTPVQNTLSELWSVLHFVAPDVFECLRDFVAWFNAADASSEDGQRFAGNAHGTLRLFFDPSRLANSAGTENEATAGQQQGGTRQRDLDSRMSQAQAEAIVRMHRALRPFMLRRTKEMIDVTLPPLVQIVVRSPPSALQHAAYVRAIDASQNKRRSQLHVTQLRLLCGHPYLVPGHDPFRKQILANKCQTRWPDDPELEAEYHRRLVADSGKLAVLKRLLTGLLPRGHRVLVFSQFVVVLDIIEEVLQYHALPGLPRPEGDSADEMTESEARVARGYVRLDGTQNVKERQAAIDAFTGYRTSGVRLFLLSTRSGGVGLNLTAADTVVLFDGDYNPHNDVQAISRAHRIGQREPVAVYRLVTSKTVEDTVLRFGVGKLRMERVLIGCGGFDGTAFVESAPEPDVETPEGRAAFEAADAQEAQGAAHELLEVEREAARDVAAALLEQSRIGDGATEAAADISDEELEALVDRTALLERFRTAAPTAKGQPTTHGTVEML